MKTENGYVVVKLLLNGWQTEAYYFGPKALSSANRRMAELNRWAKARAYGVFGAYKTPSGESRIYFERATR